LEADGEEDHEAALSRLREVTPEGLQKIIIAALEDRDERLNQTIDRLAASDAEAAQLLRSLMDELAGLRRSRYLNAGMTEEFADAANRLYRIYNSGMMEQFISAARRMPDR
jgi:hypothetical protein